VLRQQIKRRQYGSLGHKGGNVAEESPQSTRNTSSAEEPELGEKCDPGLYGTLSFLMKSHMTESVTAPQPQSQGRKEEHLRFSTVMLSTV
jgi:hypothetical protein